MHQKSFTISLLASVLAVSGLAATRADTIETTQTTTTTTSGTGLPVTNMTVGNLPVMTLPSTGRYVVVDPITGQLQGSYDARARLVDGHELRSGLVVVNQVDGGPIGYVDSSGNIVDMATSPASETLLVSIETRRKDLNARIDEALNKGVLTPTRAASFRAELDRIAADEESDRRANGVITYKRALMLGYGLNTLSDRLIPISSVTYQPVVAPQFVTIDGRLTLLDATNYRKQHLATRVDDEYAAGRLSENQVSKLKQSLSKVSSTENKYIKNGALSSSKDRKLASQLDKVQAQMDSDIAIINRKRANIGIRSD